MIYQDTPLQQIRLIKDAAKFGVTRDTLGDYYINAIDELRHMLKDVPLERLPVAIDQYLEECGVKPSLKNKHAWEGEDMPQVDMSRVNLEVEESTGPRIPIFEPYSVQRFTCTKIETENEGTDDEVWKMTLRVLSPGQWENATKYQRIKWAVNSDGDINKTAKSILRNFGDGDGLVTPDMVIGKEIQAKALPTNEYNGKTYQGLFDFSCLTPTADEIVNEIPF